MSEAGFRIFGEIFSAGAELFHTACLALFLKPFLPREGHRQRKLLFIFWVCLAARAGCHMTAVPQGTFGLLLLVILTAAAGFLGMEREMAALLVLLYWNVRTCGSLILESLYFLLERLMPLQTGVPEKIYLRGAALVMLFLISHGAVLACMLYLLQRQIGKRRLIPCRQELCCIGLIPAAGILFGLIVSGLLFEVQDGKLSELYERHPAFLVIVPILALLLYAGTFLTIRLRQEMAALREDEAARFVERQQEEAIRARLQETERIDMGVRRMKHEMRGHMTNIRGLAKSGRYKELEEYIAQMEGDMKDFEMVFQTGNPVTDLIINDKRRQCLEAGISFRADFHYPADAGYRAFDMGIILQNLLRNALEAAERTTKEPFTESQTAKKAGKGHFAEPEAAEAKKAMREERFIELTGKRKGRFFLIEVRNSFAGEVVFGPDDLPVSTKKEDVLMHGIGLANVRRRAQKYMGELECKTEYKAGRQEFCATVLLQERSSYE